MGDMFDSLKAKLVERKVEAKVRDERDELLDDFETRSKVVKSKRRFLRRLMDKEEEVSLDKTIKKKLSQRNNFAIGGNNILKFGNMKINKVDTSFKSVHAKNNLFRAKSIKKSKTRRR